MRIILVLADEMHEGPNGAVLLKKSNIWNAFRR